MAYSGEGFLIYGQYINGQVGPVGIDANGNLRTDTTVTQDKSVAGAVYPTAVGDTEIVLLPMNSNRKGFIIHNLTGICYIKLAPLISPYNFSYRLTNQSVLELDNYIGVVTAIRDSGNTGLVMVTEKV